MMDAQAQAQALRLGGRVRQLEADLCHSMDVLAQIRDLARGAAAGDLDAACQIVASADLGVRAANGALGYALGCLRRGGDAQ